MPTKMRLQRFGKKGRPFYHIVIADGRAPRDGRFIEKIGTYNPISKPAEIDLDFQKAYDWFRKGADPTPTVKTILSDEGILLYNHLMKGVDKGAFTKEVAEVKFNEWKEAKQAKRVSAIKSEQLTEKEAKKKLHEQEVKVNEARAAEIAKKRQQEVAAAEAENAEATDTVAEETAPEAEETAPEAAEESASEASEEAAAE
ncbi:MAG TPA: 30S ribosomal protein S16 [Bacteroidales bacterium]|nr:30S ribosomal protein S16 [Bacteroidales bacterium]